MRNRNALFISQLALIKNLCIIQFILIGKHIQFILYTPICFFLWHFIRFARALFQCLFFCCRNYTSLVYISQVFSYVCLLDLLPIWLFVLWFKSYSVRLSFGKNTRMFSTSNSNSNAPIMSSKHCEPLVDFLFSH